MKVLHISTGLAGAGMCAEKIHFSLIREGLDSRMLVLAKPKNENITICSPYIKKGMWNYLYRIVRKLFRTIHVPITEEDKFVLDGYKYQAYYSTPQVKLDITSHPWVKWADIIHLHWCNNFFDQPKFFKTITDKPIVWTLHDENLFYGTAHYHDAVLKEDRLERKYYKLKHEMVSNAQNLSIVFLSQYFINSFSYDKMLSGKKIFKINNPVDCSQFHICDRKTSRDKLVLPKDKKILLFVATSITDRHKGLQALIDAVRRLESDNLLIVAIGGKKGYVDASSDNVKAVGKVYGSEKLSLYYSAADAYVLPSYQEAFSQSCIESLSCGTPVVAFPVGVCVDCIKEQNGYLCKDYSVEELAYGIDNVLSRQFNRQSIRSLVDGKFDSSTIAKQYVKMYESVLAEVNNQEDNS